MNKISLSEQKEPPRLLVQYQLHVKIPKLIYFSKTFFARSSPSPSSAHVASSPVISTQAFH